MSSCARINLIVALLLGSVPLVSQAAVVTQTYKNATEITNLFLWSEDPADMTFVDVDLSDKKLAGWTIPVTFADRLVLDGPQVKKGKKAAKFNIEFDYSAAPFKFQFAEVLFDDATATWALQKTGSIEFKGGKLGKSQAYTLSAAQLGHINDYFSVPAPAAVPIPRSMLLMVSAVAFLGVGSRKAGAATNTPAAA